MDTAINDYYGKELTTSDDLQTDACCTIDSESQYLRDVLKNIHPKVLEKYFGCGLIAPELLDGLHILDLGSGSGRDVYALAQIVGENGSVIGVDGTDEQLAVALEYTNHHAKVFGYERSNVDFIKGDLESLAHVNLDRHFFDIIVSNCVINLVQNKEDLFREIFRLLNNRGEFYFSDVYCDRRVPQELINDDLLRGECLSGAMYWNDFLTTVKDVGFHDPRLVTSRPLAINNPDIAAKLEGYNFYSATYRLFKLSDLESACEDYGQSVIYRGTIPHHPDVFELDAHHHIATGEVFPVCGNTYRMLRETRFADHFAFEGNQGVHHGIFEGCGTTVPFSQDVATKSQCC